MVYFPAIHNPWPLPGDGTEFWLSLFRAQYKYFTQCLASLRNYKMTRSRDRRLSGLMTQR